MLEELLPASELPIWRAHYSDEPWGFDAEDYLHSKNAFFTSTVLKQGTGIKDLMEDDPYANLSLTPEQFEKLDDEEKNLYTERLVARAKASKK
jgi:hypothetical protein